MKFIKLDEFSEKKTFSKFEIQISNKSPRTKLIIFLRIMIIDQLTESINRIS